MRTAVQRCAFLALLIPATLAGQSNWRLIDTVSVAGLKARVEVSSARTVRIAARGDTINVISAGLRSDSLRRWLNHLTDQIGRPDAERSAFEDAIALTPERNEGTVVGFLLAMSDTSGRVSSVFALPGDVARLARVLVHAAEAGLRLTERELQRPGKVRFRPVDRDSKETPAYPDSMRNAEIEDDVLVAFVVDTAGYARLSSVRLLQGRNRQFFDAVIEILPVMKFRPAEVEGHKYEDMVAIPFSFRLIK